MADLFSVTAPLMIRHASGEREVMIERFRHPKGLLYFVPFWHLGNPGETVKFVEGEIRGEGPWKIGSSVIQVLGCQGTEPMCAAEFDSWRDYLTQAGAEYPPPAMTSPSPARAGRWSSDQRGIAPETSFCPVSAG